MVSLTSESSGSRLSSPADQQNSPCSVVPSQTRFPARARMTVARDILVKYWDAPEARKRAAPLSAATQIDPSVVWARAMVFICGLIQASEGAPEKPNPG